MKAFLAELREGWRDLLGATLGLACGIGFYTPVSSLFFRALEQQFGWSKTTAAVSLIALPITALCLPLAGWILDRVGVRITAGTSAVLMAVCFVWLSALDGSPIVFYAAFIGFNVLGCATGPVSYTRVVAARFQRGRGLALATALVGLSVSGMILPPVLARVIAETGWRAGYQLLAAIACAGGLLAILIMAPETRGHSPEGGRELTVSPGAAIRSRAFWLLASAIFCTSAAAIGFVSQFQSVLIENGQSITRATYLISALAGSVFCSRLVVGWALDAFRPERVAAAAIGLSAIGISMLLIPQGSFPYTLVAVLLIGFSIGAELDLLSYFCARNFGLQRYSSVYGALAIFFYAGMAAGGLLYGIIHDLSGTYAGAIAISSALFLLAACVFLALGGPPRRKPHDNALSGEQVSQSRASEQRQAAASQAA